MASVSPPTKEARSSSQDLPFLLYLMDGETARERSTVSFDRQLGTPRAKDSLEIKSQVHSSGRVS